FGGVFSTAATYAWDGTAWFLVSNTGPAARQDLAMTTDTGRGRVVLFAGRPWEGGAAFADTWEWDGSWHQVQIPGPSARYFHSLAYDAHRSRVVLFGGRGDGNVNLYDTWEYDGNQWTNVTPPDGQLSPHLVLALAYDPVQQRVLGTHSNETWTWDG